jgi:hypothetical protein
MMHDGERVAGLLHMDAGQRAPGAADQIEIPPDALGQERHGVERLLGNGAGADRVARGAIGQAQHAEFGRLGGLHAAGTQMHELHRTAADVGQDAVGVRNAAEQAGGR